MKRVLILNGVAQCGKDTFADAITDRACDNEVIPFTVSTVDLVKEMLELAGINRNRKTDADRKLMSDLKDLLTEHSDIPFLDIVGKIGKWSEEFDFTIFMVMCREPKEIQKFKDFYGDECVTIIITRPELDVPNNHADQNVANFVYDIEIANSGTVEELEAIAQHVCDTIFDE